MFSPHIASVSFLEIYCSYFSLPVGVAALASICKSKSKNCLSFTNIAIFTIFAIFLRSSTGGYFMSENKNNVYDVVIIGGGPAGLTSAIYLARAYYRVLIIEKEKFGGQISLTSEVVNYPGVIHTSGEELSEDMRKQAQNFGAEFMLSEVKSIEAEGDIKKVHTARGTIECFGIVIATGARPKMIGFEGEEEFRGHGVAYCATCDGEFFTGKQVYVVGGGFAAAEESMFLTKYAKNVTLLIRKDDFSCAKSVADQVKAHDKINILTNTEVVRVEGDSILRSITYKNNKTGEETKVDYANEGFGVFVFAGYAPATGIFKGQIDLDEAGYVITDKVQKTSVDGIYAAGDVCIKPLRQVVTAVGDGALAATELEKYVSTMHKKTGIVPERKEPVKAVHSAESKSASKSGEADEGLFSEDMLAQLDMIFSRMERSLKLKLYLDNREVSDELKNYMESLAALTDKLSVETVQDEALENKPCVRVCYEDGSYAGLSFHGVPGGHEFTSFVLGLYNAAGPGQALEDDVSKRIDDINKEVNIKIVVSLTCTVCPDLVAAAYRVAAASPKVNTEIYDINHFGEIKDKYQIMSVPCMLINDAKPQFGKKDVRQLLDLIEQA